MPTYQYKCSKCGEVFEAFQKMSDPPIKECPHCQGRVERIISGGAGFLLKGSGFYATDYRSSDYKKAAAADISKPEIITPKGDSKKT
jgi:putative FmdB family regulatory protein